MTRLAFLIKRKNYYRPLGPLVDEALRRGWRVECWHDHAQPRSGVKGSLFPDDVPAFRAGAPRVLTYRGGDELGRRFALDPPDAIVSVDPPEDEVVRATPARWFWLQFAADLVLHPAAPRGFAAATAVGLFSPWWLAQLEQHFGSERFDASARDKAAAVGMPMLDVAPEIDPDRVRFRYGLPAGKPIVLYFQFPLQSFPPSFWLRNVFRPSTRLAQGLATGFGRRRGHRGRRRDYWPHVRNGWNDRHLVQAIRAFCDRNGAALVLKSREKDPVPDYARPLAEACLDDPSFHPPTSLELLRCASLCVHAYSTAVLESVWCGVPSLCLAPEAADVGLDVSGGDRIHHGRPGGIYHWPGAAYWTPLAEAFEGLPRRGLAEFPLEAGARRGYVERFLGEDDAGASGRFLDLVADRIGSPAA